MQTAQFTGSSFLVSARYDETARTLDITFNNGRTYTYVGVPPDVFQELESADSPGSYYHSVIRNNYGG